MPLVGTLTCLLLVAACSSPVEHQAGDAAPAGSPAPTTGAPTATTPASPAPSVPSAPSAPASSGDTTAPLVLGPNGIGSLKLGMTRQQATATGLLIADEDNSNGEGCVPYHLRANSTGNGVVSLSRNLGIAAIDAYGSIKTPEGVRIGMSSADMLRIYPGWTAADGDATNGRGHAKAPGNDSAVYRIATQNGTVIELTLQYAKQDCYE
ncbi:hypothetical protein OG792_05485 [Micromonospora sp. NBC_01699]|uniref:hypothetical protein n=1 Tax=Micromonospora sp. NBC_01699 TaxID=2975984 RepID=UPI002E319799|nr:hypothetical protein [Micromonospora sp. NBC_01699]